MLAATIIAIAAVLFAGMGSSWAKPRFAVAPTLGTAGAFAVLAGSTATNTGPTILVGDLGVSPGSAITGFPPGIVTGGTIHSADAVALQAQTDVIVAYDDLADQPCTADLTGQDLGGLTLTPGVYCFPNTSAGLTGALTLDGLGDPGAVFVFKIGSTLTTASDSSVLVLNGAAACNVFWQVGSSATLGTGTDFVGNILALQSITMNTNANLLGRALARNGAVTMDSNSISSVCAVPSPTNTPGPSDGTTTPVATATPPIGGSPTPVATGTPPPVNGTPTPVATGTLPPVNGTPTPVATGTQPPGNETPPPGNETPPPGNETPPPGNGTPPPQGEGTPGAPTALDPVDQPAQTFTTLYLPYSAK